MKTNNNQRVLTMPNQRINTSLINQLCCNINFMQGPTRKAKQRTSEIPLKVQTI